MPCSASPPSGCSRSALSLLGSGARGPTLAFVGWFGPRGLATIVFAVIMIDESALPNERTLLLAVVATIGISVFAHGLTSRPLTDRYVALVRLAPPRAATADGERSGRLAPIAQASRSRDAEREGARPASITKRHFRGMELSGFEPLTSWVRSRFRPS